MCYLCSYKISFRFWQRRLIYHLPAVCRGSHCHLAHTGGFLYSPGNNSISCKDGNCAEQIFMYHIFYSLPCVTRAHLSTQLLWYIPRREFDSYMDTLVWSYLSAMKWGIDCLTGLPPLNTHYFFFKCRLGRFRRSNWMTNYILSNCRAMVSVNNDKWCGAKTTM